MLVAVEPWRCLTTFWNAGSESPANIALSNPCQMAGSAGRAYLALYTREWSGRTMLPTAQRGLKDGGMVDRGEAPG